jgi:hypothetical protein
LGFLKNSYVFSLFWFKLPTPESHLEDAKKEDRANGKACGAIFKKNYNI